MSYAVFILGPSGSGKSTLTGCLQQVYKQLHVATTVVNLDAADDSVDKYQPDIDINELIRVEDVMEEFGIGPNNAVLYCMEFLETNVDWLLEKMKQRGETLFLFDLPGQIELYVNHQSLRTVVDRIQKAMQVCFVELFDCTYVYGLKHFLSMCMMSLASMINFEVPHINVLNKIDLMKGRRLGTHLQDYLNAPSLQEMVEFMNPKYEDGPLLDAIAKVIDSYGLVSFIPLDVQRIELVSKLIFQVEECLGVLATRYSNKHFKALMEKYYRSGSYEQYQDLIDLELYLFNQYNNEEEYNSDLQKERK